MLRLEVKIICWIYSHQRAVLTSSLSQSSPTSMPACWTRFKSTLYNEDGSKTSTFLTNDSLSFLGKKKTWNFEIPDRQLLYRSFLLTRSSTMRICWKLKKVYMRKSSIPRGFFSCTLIWPPWRRVKTVFRVSVFLLEVGMSNGACWFCHDGLKLSVEFFCWIFWFSMPHIVITIERDCLELKNRSSILSS